MKKKKKRKLNKRIPFGYLCEQWDNIPEWSTIEHMLIPGEDLLILDTEMFVNFNEEFQEAKKEVERNGIHIGLYIASEFLHMENDEFYNECVDNNIKDFITNAPTKCMDYKMRKASGAVDSLSVRSHSSGNVQKSELKATEEETYDKF